MTRSEYRELAIHCGHAANVMRQLAHPLTWPEWMTQKRREEMAARFEQYQIEIDEAVNRGDLPHVRPTACQIVTNPNGFVQLVTIR